MDAASFFFLIPIIGALVMISMVTSQHRREVMRKQEEAAAAERERDEAAWVARERLLERRDLARERGVIPLGGSLTNILPDRVAFDRAAGPDFIGEWVQSGRIIELRSSIPPEMFREIRQSWINFNPIEHEAEQIASGDIVKNRHNTLIAISHEGALVAIDTNFHGRQLFLRVHNGTIGPDGEREHYAICVPGHIDSVREAIAWTYGIDAMDYHEVVRT